MAKKIAETTALLHQIPLVKQQVDTVTEVAKESISEWVDGADPEGGGPSAR